MIVAGRNPVIVFALLGAVSGTITTGALFMLPPNWKIEVAGFLMVSRLAFESGLACGVLLGRLL